MITLTLHSFSGDESQVCTLFVVLFIDIDTLKNKNTSQILNI